MKVLIPLVTATLLAAPLHAFELSSPDLTADAPIPKTYAFDAFGCTGDNVSPAMAWTEPPEGTRSFALMDHDPDARTGGAGFWHWAIIDIPADATSLPRGTGTTGAATLPSGARQISSDFGVPGWGGPCPPEADGAHRYDFTLYALPVDHLELPDPATASLAGFVVNGMALGQATFTAIYDR